MYTFLGVLGVFALFVVAVLILASRKPATCRTERTAKLNAPAEKIFPLINDFHKWALWSPFEDLDPNLKRTFSGPQSGVGAVYEWSGNSKAGQGRMEIVEAKQPNKVRIDLRFLKPFKCNNIAEFKLVPNGNTTEVTWTMTGPNFFIGKVMSVFISMDKMVGESFEKGLASLGAQAAK